MRVCVCVCVCMFARMLACVSACVRACVCVCIYAGAQVKELKHGVIFSITSRINVN